MPRPAIDTPIAGRGIRYTPQNTSLCPSVGIRGRLQCSRHTQATWTDSDRRTNRLVQKLPFRKITPSKNYPSKKLPLQKNYLFKKITPSKKLPFKKITPSKNYPSKKLPLQKNYPSKITSSKNYPSKITPSKKLPLQKLPLQKLLPQKITPSKKLPQKPTWALRFFSRYRPALRGLYTLPFPAPG